MALADEHKQAGPPLDGSPPTRQAPAWSPCCSALAVDDPAAGQVIGGELHDDTVARAVQAGGTIPRERKDHGFMHVHAFEDLDGHTWELAYMEPGAQS